MYSVQIVQFDELLFCLTCLVCLVCANFLNTLHVKMTEKDDELVYHYARSVTNEEEKSHPLNSTKINLT